MAVTPNYNLNLPAQGQHGWKDLLNQNFDKIDVEIKNNSDKIGDLSSIPESDLVSAIQADRTSLAEMTNEINTLNTNKADKTEVNSLATAKANQSDVNNALALKRDKSAPIGVADITSELQSAIAGTAPIANSIPANQSVTVNTVANETFLEISRRNDYAQVLEQKHGQLINKFAGIKNGAYDSNTDRKERITVAFIDSDNAIPYPKEKVSKIMRLTYNNNTASTNSSTWGKKVPITDVTKPITNGYWIKKSQLASLIGKTFTNLIAFYNVAGTMVNYVFHNILNMSSTIVLGYKTTATRNGITVTYEVKEEYGDWLYIVNTINLSDANTSTVEFQFCIANIPASETGIVDVVGWTVIEGDSVTIPYLIYAENANEVSKTDAEISSNLKNINDTLGITTKKVYTTYNFGYNLEKPLLKYRSSLSKRLSQIVKIACVGDSITDGFWSGLNHERAYPVRLRKLMQAKYGGQDEGLVTIDIDDQRWTQSGTGWVKDGYGIAARRRKSSVSGDYLTFTFTGVGVDIFYSKNTDGGSCAIYVDDVLQAPLNCYGATEILAQKQSYTGFSSGNHTLKIYAPTDGKKAYIEGAYVKTVGDTNGIRIDRRARAGSYTGDWTNSLMLSTFDTEPADLFILALGVNDCGGGRTPEQMKTGLQTIITKLKSKGDVIIVPMMQANSVADARFVNWKDYVVKFYELADENNIGLIDVHKLYGEAYEPARTYGLFGIENGDGEGNDTIHPSARGQQLIADTIFNLIG